MSFGHRDYLPSALLHKLMEDGIISRFREFIDNLFEIRLSTFFCFKKIKKLLKSLRIACFSFIQTLVKKCMLLLPAGPPIYRRFYNFLKKKTYLYYLLILILDNVILINEGLDPKNAH